MKNRFLIISCFTLFLFAFSASSQTINVVVKLFPKEQKWLYQVITLYEKKYPDRKVNVMIIGGSESDYFTKLALMLKTSSKVDVIFEDGFMLRGDVNAHILAPLPDVKKWDEWKHFFPSLQESVTLDGKIYGVPMSTDTRGLFYNTKLFKQIGIKVPWKPKDWNDIISAARIIKKKKPDVFPLAFNAGATGEATSMQTFEMFLYGTGDSLYKNDKWIVTSKGMLNSLKFIDTVFKEKLGARIDIALSPQYGNIVAQTLAPEQKAAIILDGCWQTAFWLLKYPETFKIYKLTAMPTEFGQKPGYTTMSGGWVMAVSNKSSHKKLALNFIEFALSKNNMLKYTQLIQNLATRKDVADMKEYPEHLKQATKFLDFAHFRPSNENYPIVSSYLQDAVEAVASQRQTPIEAMNQFAKSVERVLGSKNVVKLFKEKSKLGN